LNFNVGVINDPYGSYANTTATITNVATFLCPSSPEPDWLMQSANQPVASISSDQY
jgi:hypothetical protein